MSARPDHEIGDLDRTDGRGTHLVDRVGGDFLGNPGTDGGLPRRRLPRAGLQDLAHDHVLDLLRLEAGTLERSTDRDRTELRRRNGGEAAAEAPERRANGRDDDRGTHKWSVAIGRRPNGQVDTLRQTTYDVLTVAVTVKQGTPFVVLDERDRIVGVGPGAESQFGPLVGSVIWESFPGSESLFRPYYDKARRIHEAVEFVQFYDGNVARVRATPNEDGLLELYWEPLARLDTLTLGSLVETLEESLELLDEHEAGRHRESVRSALRVIEGGA